MTRGYAIIEPSRAKRTLTTLEIVCPSWCVESPEFHTGELWNQDGQVFHSSAYRTAQDKVGFHHNILDDGRPAAFHPDLDVKLVMTTNPSGAEVEPPVLHINDRTYSLPQVTTFIDHLHATIADYHAGRSAGSRG